MNTNNPETAFEPTDAQIGTTPDGALVRLTFVTKYHTYHALIPAEVAKELGKTLVGSAIIPATLGDVPRL